MVTPVYNATSKDDKNRLCGPPPTSQGGSPSCRARSSTCRVGGYRPRVPDARSAAQARARRDAL